MCVLRTWWLCIRRVIKRIVTVVCSGWSSVEIPGLISRAIKWRAGACRTFASGWRVYSSASTRTNSYLMTYEVRNYSHWPDGISRNSGSSRSVTSSEYCKPSTISTIKQLMILRWIEYSIALTRARDRRRLCFNSKMWKNNAPWKMSIN